ncbi:MAG TPA: hypothetical protein VGK74_01665 [Symbiobacteriaceae bacterium]|jgi:hypothetical protein
MTDNQRPALNVENPAPTAAKGLPARSAPSLDHGVPSLVAQDNPDDSQLGAPLPGKDTGKNV